jgi:hypothetical protein
MTVKIRIYRRWRGLRLFFAVTLAGLMVSLGLGVALVQAQDPNRVGLVVVDGDRVVRRCLEFNEAELSGYEVLERSGLELKVNVASSVDVAICRIDGQGCNYPAEDCFCQCQGSPCRFWLYWHLSDGQWQLSEVSAANYKVSHGDVEGWVWGESTPDGGGEAPPPSRFEEICVAGAEVVSAEQPGSPGPASFPYSGVAIAVGLGVGLLVIAGLAWRLRRR